MLKMKKLALTAVGLLIAGSASAADLGARPAPYKAPAPVAVAYNWTGCYVGAGGGYGLFSQRTQFAPNGVTVGVPVDNGGHGWFGTVQVGCDYQLASNIVIGAFADYDWSGIKGTMSTGVLNLVGEEQAEEFLGGWRSARLSPVQPVAGLRVRRLHPVHV